jgi:NADH-ubiquinone oxidoreductase chain 2
MLVFGIIVLLLSTAVNNRRDCSILFSRVTMLILINTIIILYVNINVNFLSDGLILYGGLMTIKNHTILFSIFILLLSTFIVSLSSFFPRKIVANQIIRDNSMKFTSLITIITNKMSDQYRIIEYPLIILFCLTGAIFLISSSDIVSIFLSIELQSYGLYLISSIYRNSESSINAGLTYFLLGGLSSCIILLGMSLLYVNTGNTNLENIYIINNIWNAFSNSLIHENIPTDNLWVYQTIYTEYTYMQIPFAIISVGLLFKIAAAPFHFWSPDVYDSIPTIVTTFVAIIAKISLLLLFLELIFYTDNSLTTLSWSNNLIISSILSLLIGSVLGLVQHRIKRLYAYSTISHVGFILLALSVNTLESTRAFFFYIIQYSISNLNAFIILISIGYSLFLYTNEYNIKENKYSPIQYISQLKGYFFINPVLAISLAITLFSFIGVPPLIGFFGKQMILTVALDNGYIFATLIAIITSVISAVYYLVLIKLIFFDNTNYKFNIKFTNFLTSHYKQFNTKDIVISSSLSFSISIFTLFILLFMFFDQELINIINITGLYL